MDLQELFGRFVLLFFSILVLYFFSNRKDNETINPLMVIVGLCTFSLCYLFTRIEIGVGIGFGLFAIFSILRFRTQTFTVNAIIFLFATITLSILDIMYPFEKIEVLLFFQFIIIGFYIIASVLVNKKASKYLNTVDVKVSLGNDFSLNTQNIRQLIQKQINIENFDFKIITINTVTKEIDVTVLY
ncbi:DUF4956 domain-containing protein [Flavobacterium hydatis]|uniref:DUF4956 domain-containing protein n=1 Tax=Flavobacterium hydatis TaxID=991 RepID=A0A086AFV5_FLAHY|nr:DUF4956 domain-containing protein [Flavobacterium hydatis]KFF15569.1 hypothetical protein IW20_13885 [Flavobacterium hydatis]OXA89847.1 DUF4956 domain-containing protein [Flavobacterium hydatis]